MVAIASPAPFTIQPTLPSSFTKFKLYLPASTSVGSLHLHHAMQKDRDDASMHYHLNSFYNQLLQFYHRRFEQWIDLKH
jgi:hypothetical protein